MTRLSEWEATALTIPSGSSLSSSMVLAGKTVVGLLSPVAWTAASICFDVSACAGGTFFPLYNDDNTIYTLKMSASRAYGASSFGRLGRFYGMRLRSGSDVAGDDQGAARVFVAFTQG
jgi:hypothetical protein